jgi:hypothetical protein
MADVSAHLPGVAFTLSVGRLIPHKMRASCLHENPNHPIFISDQVTEAVWNRLGGQYRDSRKTKKYLEAKAERELKASLRRGTLVHRAEDRPGGGR